MLDHLVRLGIQVLLTLILFPRFGESAVLRSLRTRHSRGKTRINVLLQEENNLRIYDVSN